MDSIHTLGRALLVMGLPVLIPPHYMPVKKWGSGDVWILPLLLMCMLVFVIATSMWGKSSTSHNTVFFLERLVYFSVFQSVGMLLCSHYNDPLVDNNSLLQLTSIYLLFDLVYYVQQWTATCLQHSLWPVHVMRCLAYCFLINSICHILKPAENVLKLGDIQQMNSQALAAHFQAMFVVDIGRTLFSLFADVVLLCEAQVTQGSNSIHVIKPHSF